MSSESLVQELNILWSGTTVTAIHDRNRLVAVMLRANDEARQDLGNFASFFMSKIKPLAEPDPTRYLDADTIRPLGHGLCS